MIHSILREFSLFVDGRGYVGKVPELTPPKLTLKTEEYRAGGMAAPVDIDMGLEKMTCEFTLAEYNPDIFALFGLADGNQVQITFRGAVRNSDGEDTPVLIAVRGLITEIDVGSWQAASKIEKKCKVSCRYYRLEMDGKEIHEIDAINMIQKINGVDQLAEIRKAIGI